jgi:uncharacterized zinc-type alcohol dehydrogenase-like protein
MSKVSAWVTTEAKSRFVKKEIDLGPLKDEEVEVAVESCGVCHSDLSLRDNEWGFTQYPAVLGHEIIGRVVAVGPAARGIKVGQRVGVGFTCETCMHCRQCMTGNHNLCAEPTFVMVGHQGGFASRVRSHWAWAIPIPEALPAAEVGPLLCGGITVFSPLAMHAQPTSRVGIIGIGGLGHRVNSAAFGSEVT